MSTARYFVDNRLGCIGIIDKENFDPYYQYISKDLSGVVYFRKREKIGHLKWDEDDSLLEICHQVCEMLNIHGYEETRRLLPLYEGWCDG